MPSAIWTLVKLILTVSVLASLAYGAKLLLDAVNDGIKQGKEQLAGKGVSLSKNGVAVKTDKRALTQEETQDKLQAGLMKGFKSASFNVPWILQAGTRLGGSSHDKNKAAWDAKHGPKKDKHLE